MTELYYILILGLITGILLRDVVPKITGYFNAKKGGVLETPIRPYISSRIRLISHGIFTIVFLILIIQFDEADPFTIFFIITLAIMGIVPQPHGVYEKGLRAKGHFYRWEEIEKIIVPKKTSVFQIKLDGKLRFNVTFSVSLHERQTLIDALQKKPVELETGN